MFPMIGMAKGMLEWLIWCAMGHADIGSRLFKELCK